MVFSTTSGLSDFLGSPDSSSHEVEATQVERELALCAAVEASAPMHIFVGNAAPASAQHSVGLSDAVMGMSGESEFPLAGGLSLYSSAHGRNGVLNVPSGAASTDGVGEAFEAANLRQVIMSQALEVARLWFDRQLSASRGVEDSNCSEAVTHRGLEGERRACCEMSTPRRSRHARSRVGAFAGRQCCPLSHLLFGGL